MTLSEFKNDEDAYHDWLRAKRPARPARPTVGADEVCRFLAAIAESGFLATEISVNGERLIVSVDGQVIAAIAHDVRDDGVSAIFIIANPEKLTRVNV